MRTKNHLLSSIVFLILLFTIGILGCSGGGDIETPAPRPSVQVIPSSYDFGSVTPGNSAAALEVKIENNSSSALTITDITLDDPNYVLNLNGGLKPCDTASSTILARDYCTFKVNFTPGSDGEFNTDLTISSNDSSNPTLNVPLIGIREPISELNVRINQVESTEICPDPVVTAYVSVTDQGGYPVTALAADDFSITENNVNMGSPTDASFVSGTVTISVNLVMDYSGSISGHPNIAEDMEESVAAFIDNLGDDDEAEIIKFGELIKVAQQFTSNKTLLKDAVYTSLDVGEPTALFDAVVKAVDDTAFFGSKDRKVVIVITDGKDDDGTGSQLSISNLDGVINNAKSNGIPIFTVGVGSEIDIVGLQKMADDTGGQFYEAINSDNLKTIYQQLADVLFNNQYILTYNSGLGGGDTANLTIEATLEAIVGNDTKEITSCP